MSESSELKDKALLNLDEFCAYLGIGKTNARQILNDPRCTFSFWIGSRIYANKQKLDERIRLYRTLI